MGDPTQTTRTFGERLAEKRRAKGLSQKAFGQLVGLGYQQIGRYEAGTSKVDIETLVRFAAALDVEPGELVA